MLDAVAGVAYIEGRDRQTLAGHRMSPATDIDHHGDSHVNPTVSRRRAVFSRSLLSLHKIAHGLPLSVLAAETSASIKIMQPCGLRLLCRNVG